MSELEKLLSCPGSCPGSSLPVDSQAAGMSAGVAACERTPAPAPGPQASASTAGSRLPCSFYGCKQSFTDIQHLNKHIQSHQIPTQSLPGKVFHCSSLGCSGTFPSMQQLMEHMRHHYKPNHYFLCESCRAKLRSYRALFKHLHTCAKVAKSKAARAEELNLPVTAPEAADSAEEEPMDLDHAPPPAVSSPAAAAPPISGFQAPVGSLLQDAASTPPPGSFSLLEPTVFPEDPQHFLTQTQPGAPPTSLPPGPATPGQQRPIRAVAPASPAPPTPPGSNAVWKKNQDTPGPLMIRRNSPPSSQSISTGEVQVRHGDRTRTDRDSCSLCGGFGGAGPSPLCLGALGPPLPRGSRPCPAEANRCTFHPKATPLGAGQLADPWLASVPYHPITAAALSSSRPPPSRPPSRAEAACLGGAQGQSFSSRILWEHTRGRYSCLQCGHCTPSRQEMTAHIEGQHRGPAGRPHGDMDVRGASPPFQPKASLDTDTTTTIYTQL
ncbi:hypothetical protein MATL_G00236800 [Megalops atlanticus]|uniref:C2H2-type domain-containing protein n=1 Tax=Megalops atlanticus TaxID=7932 RepID=A0A9D3T193_MEGAT|nr:hypothetical protein MATL_G00236800 [Megalops atlanticus]